MKKITLLVLLIATGSQLNFAVPPIQTHKECVSEFYRLLFSKERTTIEQFRKCFFYEDFEWEAEQLITNGFSKENKYVLSNKMEQNANKYESLLLQLMKKDEPLLTQHYSYETILKLIEKSQVMGEGALLNAQLELKFPNGNTFYFDMNPDAPITITDIWLPSGDKYNYDKKHSQIVKLRRPGIINDKDGFTNIRKEPKVDSPVVEKFVSNEIFFFTPISGSNWWPVYRTSIRPIGYISKNKITFYKDFPDAIKKKVIKMRTGC